MNRLLKPLALAALLCCGSANAITSTFEGSTLNGPTFNRLLEDLTDLSSVGSAVRYSTWQFTVDLGGVYNFLSTADYDNFTFLYSAGFDPNQPLSGALVGNDDFTSTITSGFSFSLTAGTTYTFLTTGFGNLDAGMFVNSIDGPGVVVAIPEPGTMALISMGLLAVARGARRRRANGDAEASLEKPAFT
jgi:hypothetical protein